MEVFKALRASLSIINYQLSFIIFHFSFIIYHFSFIICHLAMLCIAHIIFCLYPHIRASRHILLVRSHSLVPVFLGYSFCE